MHGVGPGICRLVLSLRVVLIRSRGLGLHRQVVVQHGLAATLRFAGRDLKMHAQDLALRPRHVFRRRVHIQILLQLSLLDALLDGWPRILNRPDLWRGSPARVDANRLV